MNYAVNIMNEDNNIDNQELLLKAIENHGAYSDCTKKLLSTLVQLAVYNTVNASAFALSKQINFSRIAVYNSLNILTKDNALKKIAKAQYELNQDKLDQILQAYYKQQKVFNLGN